MHVGVQIKLLVGSLSLAVRSTVTCFSEDAPGYFVMLKQTIFNLMSRGTPIGRFKRFQPNNEVMGDEGEVRESPDDPTIAADPFEEAEDIAFEESLKGFNDGEQVRKQQQQKLVKDTLAGLRAELKRKGKEPQGGASVWCDACATLDGTTDPRLTAPCMYSPL